MAGNPLCKHADYKPYTIARVRNLKYLDYRLVEEASVGRRYIYLAFISYKFLHDPETQVAAAREKYIDVLIAIEQTEKETMERMEAEAKRAENEELLKVQWRC